MIHVLAVIIGVIAVVSVVADMINTLVTTQTSNWKWWLSRRLAILTWKFVRMISCRMPDGPMKEGFQASLAPVLVLMMLTGWVAQQILGFGLIWWGIGGVQTISDGTSGVGGLEGLLDSVYYSGVVFFTVGFGEVLPSGTIPRFGALVEAFSGVLTTALVIGYLPALYGAYSERERKLMTLDDGSDDRITPTNLICAWSPDGSASELVSHFEPWEDWVAGILVTHTSFPMLRLFRSQHAGQNWVTALGLLADASLHCEIIEGANNRAPYFLFRRIVKLFRDLTEGADLSEYRRKLDVMYEAGEGFAGLHQQLVDHGFDVLPYEEGRQILVSMRRQFDAELEYLIDELLAPRGFWGHALQEQVDGFMPSVPSDG